MSTRQIKIFIAVEHNEEAVEHLRSRYDIEVFLSRDVPSGKWFVPKDIAEKVNILFCELPPENISKMRSLELVQISSTGYSQLGHALPKGITLREAVEVDGKIPSLMSLIERGDYEVRVDILEKDQAAQTVIDWNKAIAAYDSTRYKGRK